MTKTPSFVIRHSSFASFALPPLLITDPVRWDSALAALPAAHLLQCWQWGEFKSHYGWSAKRLLWKDGERPVAAAQILKRRIGPLSILYVPKGPCLDWADTALATRVLFDLEALVRRERAIFIKIDAEFAAPPSTLHASRFTPSASQVQFKNTVHLDLTRAEEEIIASFKQKTRYNIRLAERKGVSVRAPAPLDVPYDLLYRLYAETSVRDGFVIRHADYYRDAWGSFIESGRAQPFIAEVEGQPVAAIIVFHFAGRALYMYGMSSGQHREKMPNHLLQWAAIRWAKERGCAVYDFWGAPDVFDESDPMYGVWRFKEGFNGALIRTPGAFDYAPSPALYRLYTLILPRLLDAMRQRGKAQTRRALAD
ncbi:MAG: peptidoglycan bridge formation glycyltransferase FemA/FemB family protein [Chloroflexi bacterium]|nr:peptidoglycan bridge formation glycyltransferase FemA/FemB family protein [Chloroflexota bacterium]